VNAGPDEELASSGDDAGTLAGAGLAGGCSEADQINNRVFGAVRKDPLYLWRPDWVTSVSDSETPLGGIYPEAAASFTHYLDADDLPSTALNDALILAPASGWRVSANGIGHGVHWAVRMNKRTAAQPVAVRRQYNRSY
jgi:hypothetical protein